MISSWFDHGFTWGHLGWLGFNWVHFNLILKRKCVMISSWIDHELIWITLSSLGLSWGHLNWVCACVCRGVYAYESHFFLLASPCFIVMCRHFSKYVGLTTLHMHTRDSLAGWHCAQNAISAVWVWCHIDGNSFHAACASHLFFTSLCFCEIFFHALAFTRWTHQWLWFGLTAIYAHQARSNPRSWILKPILQLLFSSFAPERIVWK